MPSIPISMISLKENPSQGNHGKILINFSKCLIQQFGRNRIFMVIQKLGDNSLMVIRIMKYLIASIALWAIIAWEYPIINSSIPPSIKSRVMCHAMNMDIIYGKDIMSASEPIPSLGWISSSDKAFIINKRCLTE